MHSDTHAVVVSDRHPCRRPPFAIAPSFCKQPQPCQMPPEPAGILRPLARAHFVRNLHTIWSALVFWQLYTHMRNLQKDRKKSRRRVHVRTATAVIGGRPTDGCDDSVGELTDKLGLAKVGFILELFL